MPTGYTYTTFQTALASHMVLPTTDTDFVAMLPSIIDYAELRCYRDLDPLFLYRTGQSNCGGLGTEADAILHGPIDLVEVRDLWIHIPGVFGTTRVALERRNDGFLNEYWPDRTSRGQPKYYAIIGGDYGPLLSSSAILMVPTPDAQYPVTLNYTIRPDTLSATNTSTFLSLQYPDLMMAAALVYVASYQKAYQDSLPAWQALYGQALAAARVEEARRKGRDHVDLGSPSAVPQTAQ